jgi:hypothetical protein
MKGRIQIFGLVGLSVLVVLISSAPGGKPAASIALKVSLSPVLQSTIPEAPGLMPCALLSDTGLPYEHVSEKTFANCIQIADPGTAGYFRMYINKDNSAGRWVRMMFYGDVLDPGNPDICAPNAYFLADKELDASEAGVFNFRSTYLYSEQTIGGVLTLTNTMTFTDLSKMKLGDSVIVGSWVYFSVADDLSTKEYNESRDRFELEYHFPVRVKRVNVDGDPALEWTISPIQEHYYDTKDWRYDFPFGSLMRGLYANGRPNPCCYGNFKFPFELTLDPK